MPAMSGDSVRNRYDEKGGGGGRAMSVKDKTKRLEPYMPPKASEAAQINNARRRSVFGLRRYCTYHAHVLLFTVIHGIFSIYINIRQWYHFLKDRTLSFVSYHHHTPYLIERDVQKLARIPSHLSVILELEDNGRRGGAELERLMNELADIAAWCACAGIPMLSVYEKTGLLKGHMQQAHHTVEHKLATYYGQTYPAVTLRAPHSPSIESPPRHADGGSGKATSDGRVKHLTVLLIAADNGRDSIVDLTKTLTVMAQRAKISPADISMDLVDTELSEGVMSEPDLLILFSPDVELKGYPPWQIRLTEIFHVQDNHDVGYHVFLRGLQNFASAKMRFGK